MQNSHSLLLSSFISHHHCLYCFYYRFHQSRLFHKMESFIAELKCLAVMFKRAFKGSFVKPGLGLKALPVSPLSNAIQCLNL